MIFVNSVLDLHFRGQMIYILLLATMTTFLWKFDKQLPINNLDRFFTYNFKVRWYDIFVAGLDAMILVTILFNLVQ